MIRNVLRKPLKELTETVRLWKDANLSWQVYENGNETVLMQRIRAGSLDRDRIVGCFQMLVEQQSRTELRDVDNGYYSEAELYPRNLADHQPPSSIVFRDFLPLIVAGQRSTPVKIHPEVAELELLSNEQLESRECLKRLEQQLDGTDGNDRLQTLHQRSAVEARLKSLELFSEALSILFYQCDALQELHRQQKVYLECNLMNVGMDRSGAIRLLPGPAYPINQQVRRRCWIDDLNGEDIISPEIRQNRAATVASDIYCAIQTSIRFLGLRLGRELKSTLDLSSESFLNEVLGTPEEREKFRPVIELLEQASSLDNERSYGSMNRLKNAVKQKLVDPQRERVERDGNTVLIEKPVQKNYKPYLILAMSLVVAVLFWVQNRIDQSQSGFSSKPPVGMPTSSERDRATPVLPPNAIDTENSPEAEAVLHHPEDSRQIGKTGKVDLPSELGGSLPSKNQTVGEMPTLAPTQQLPVILPVKSASTAQQPSNPGSKRLPSISKRKPPTAGGQDAVRKDDGHQVEIQQPEDGPASRFVRDLPSFEMTCHEPWKPSGLSREDYRDYLKLIKQDLVEALGTSDATASQARVEAIYERATRICDTDFRLDLLCGLICERNARTRCSRKLFARAYEKCRGGNLSKQDLPRRYWIRELVKSTGGTHAAVKDRKSRALQEVVQYCLERKQAGKHDPAALRLALYVIFCIRLDPENPALLVESDFALEKLRSSVDSESEGRDLASLIQAYEDWLKSTGDKPRVGGRKDRTGPVELPELTATSAYGTVDDQFLYDSPQPSPNALQSSVEKGTAKLWRSRRNLFPLLFELNYYFEFQSILNSFEEVE